MFVTRTRFTAMERRALDAEVSRDTAWKLVATAQTMWQDLFDKYHALRLAGASIPEPAPVVQPVPRRENDRVTEVIADIAESNAKLRTRLHAFARKQRAENVDDDAIIQQLFNWKEDDGGVPE